MTLTLIPPRKPRADDALAGRLPSRVYEPATVEELAAIFVELHRAGDAVGMLGTGTLRDLGAPPSRFDALVRTRAMDRILEYAPADQVVTVEAGVTLGALQAELAAHGQRLAYDPPGADDATLGGLIAANAYGARRTRFGALKDLIIGATIVRADGVPARGGGKVVKNVAGFDLPKLMVGSLGTLGAIVRATFRVHPVPPAVRHAVVHGLDARALFGVHRMLVDAQLEPAALLAVATAEAPGAYSVLVTFEGLRVGADGQGDAFVELALRAGWDASLADEALAGGLDRVHAAARAMSDLSLGITMLPARFPALQETAIEPIVAALQAARIAVYPALGVAFIAGVARGDESIAALAQARAAAERDGGTLVLRSAPTAVRAALDVWGTPPAAIGLMREVKQRFDPDGRLAPGRFVGGL